jgi:hypothetical protein
MGPEQLWARARHIRWLARDVADDLSRARLIELASEYEREAEPKTRAESAQTSVGAEITHES